MALAVFSIPNVLCYATGAILFPTYEALLVHFSGYIWVQ